MAKLLDDPPPERWDPDITHEMWWSRNLALWRMASPILIETLSHLEAKLVPLSEAEVREQLYKLSLGFAKASDDGQSWADTTELYLEHLEGYAAAAWKHAVRKWVCGNHTFFPSLGDLYGILEAWTQARLGELRGLRRLTELEPPQDTGPGATLAEVLQLRGKYRIPETAASEPEKPVQRSGTRRPFRNAATEARLQAALAEARAKACGSQGENVPEQTT